MSVAEVYEPVVDPDPTYSLGERIRRARLDAGLQQGELALRVGVSRPQVSKWERNIAVPDVVEAVRISEVTNKPLGWLAGANPNLRWYSVLNPLTSVDMPLDQMELPFVPEVALAVAT